MTPILHAHGTFAAHAHTALPHTPQIILLYHNHHNWSLINHSWAVADLADRPSVITLYLFILTVMISFLQKSITVKPLKKLKKQSVKNVVGVASVILHPFFIVRCTEFNGTSVGCAVRSCDFKMCQKSVKNFYKLWWVWFQWCCI